MMHNNTKDIPSYVLFGCEAVYLYKISVKHLLHATNIEFNVKPLSSVKDFIKESEKWDDYIEIEHDEYQKIRLHLKKNPEFTGEVKKSFFARLFSA